MTPAVLSALSQTNSSPTLNGLIPFPPKPQNSKQNIFLKNKISRRDIASLSFSFSFIALSPFLSPIAPASAFSIGICTHNSFAFIDFYFFFLVVIIKTVISCLVHSRTERLVKRAKEEVLEVHLGTDWRFARNSSLCVSLTQYDSLFLSDSLVLLLLILIWFDLFGFWIAARDSEYTNKDLEEIQELLRSAARDCVPQERNSLVSFQASTGVEVRFLFRFLNLGFRLLWFRRYGFILFYWYQFK